jgi:hypothetical protein
MLSSETEEGNTWIAGHFEIFKDLQNTTGRMGGEIFYHFLNKIFDRQE